MEDQNKGDGENKGRYSSVHSARTGSRFGAVAGSLLAAGIALYVTVEANKAKGDVITAPSYLCVEKPTDSLIQTSPIDAFYDSWTRDETLNKDWEDYSLNTILQGTEQTNPGKNLEAVVGENVVDSPMDDNLRRIIDRARKYTLKETGEEGVWAMIDPNGKRIAKVEYLKPTKNSKENYLIKGGSKDSKVAKIINGKLKPTILGKVFLPDELKSNCDDFIIPEIKEGPLCLVPSS